MGSEKLNVPQRRFKEFENTGAWEQRKLGDLLDVSTGKLDANAMVEDGEYDFYTSGIKKYRIDVPAFEGPAITIAGNGATVGYMHLADGKFNAYQRTYVLEGFQADRQFLYSEIGNKLPRKIAEEARTGNIPYIVMDMLTDLNITLPVKEEEQRRIGSFFSNLDNLITLHQRKLDKIQAMKKSYLSEMFPAEGETKPKRRFSGFTDDWEQRKLIEVLDIQDGDRGKNYPTESDFSERGHTLFLNASNVTTSGFAFQDKQYITEEKSNSMGNGKLYEDDIVITSRGSLGHVAWYNTDIAREIPFTRINSGMLILRKKSDINTSYIYQFMKSDKGQNQITFISFGSAQPQLTKKGVENLTILFPKCVEEQERLGYYFTHLDHLITLHQRKLEKLKNMKQAYLTEMFV